MIQEPIRRRQKGKAYWERAKHANTLSGRGAREKQDEATSTYQAKKPADNTSENSTQQASELTAIHPSYISSAHPRETQATDVGSANSRQHTEIQL